MGPGNLGSGIRDFTSGITGEPAPTITSVTHAVAPMPTAEDLITDAQPAPEGADEAAADHRATASV